MLSAKRESLREQLFDLLDPVMTILGLVTVTLLLVEFAVDLSLRQAGWVGRAQQIFWAIFAIEFAAQFALALRKLAFLRRHWLAAVPVALPALRVFRALRSLRLVRLVGGTNRAMASRRQMLRGRQFGYLVALTLLVVGRGTDGVYVFERDAPGATIPTLGDALWWSACMVTTINKEKYAASPEGRVAAIPLRVYAVSIFGLVTANIASYFAGQRQGERAAVAPRSGGDAPEAVVEELRRLREEVRRLATAPDRAPYPPTDARERRARPDD